MKAMLALALLALATMAGCMGGSDDDQKTVTPPPVGSVRYTLPEDPMPEGAGHDHTVVSQHKFLWNYEFSDRDPIQMNAANIAGLHAIDVQDGWLFGAIYGSHLASVDGGLGIWDVHTDPAHPKFVGKWTIPGSVGGDRSMEATADGNYAVIAMEPLDCLGHVNPLGGAVGAWLIDTHDKALPLVSDVLTSVGPSGGDILAGGLGRGLDPSLGEHSVAVHRIGSADYAFIFGKIYRIATGESGGAKLEYVNGIPTGHDIYLKDTPWGDVWALSANGGGGLEIFNVTDPSNPYRIGTWDLEERTDLAGQGINYYFHTADVAWIEGHTILVMSSEDWEDHVSPLWILNGDAMRHVKSGEDPVTLDLLGSWQNPGNHTALGTSFSLHNPRLQPDGVLTISSYHAGLWQLDLRHPDLWAKPSAIAYAVYAEGEPAAALDPIESAIENAQCGLGIRMDTPTYMDLEQQPDGTVYLADVFMGLYTFTPTASHPVYGVGAVASDGHH